MLLPRQADVIFRADFRQGLLWFVVLLPTRWTVLSLATVSRISTLQHSGTPTKCHLINPQEHRHAKWHAKHLGWQLILPTNWTEIVRTDSFLWFGWLWFKHIFSFSIHLNTPSNLPTSIPLWIIIRFVFLSDFWRVVRCKVLLHTMFRYIFHAISNLNHV